MSGLLTSIIPKQSYLNQSINKVIAVLRSQEFQTFLKNSDLQVLSDVHKGYPNMDTSEIESYEAWVNTNNQMDCQVWDNDGVELLIVVDIFLPDNALKYIWKYADAVSQWFWQFNMRSLFIEEMVTRIYSKAGGDSANHFTVSLDLIADRFIDEDVPTLVEGN